MYVLYHSAPAAVSAGFESATRDQITACVLTRFSHLTEANFVQTQRVQDLLSLPVDSEMVWCIAGLANRGVFYGTVSAEVQQESTSL